MRWDELGPVGERGFDPLHPAEVKLLKALRGVKGGADYDYEGFIWISEKSPRELGDDEFVRAELIRHLLLRRDKRAALPERGLRVAGAKIIGPLDLVGAVLQSDLGLIRCLFDAAPLLRGASCQSLYFMGSEMPGIVADRLRCAGGLFLRGGFQATDEVLLLGVDIGGNLDCADACLRAQSGIALNLASARVRGNVFLSGKFISEGAISMIGAEVGGQLSCSGASIYGGGAGALFAERARIAGHVFLRDGFSAVGVLDFTGARLGAFVDDDGCAASVKVAPQKLIGCVYEAIHCKDGSFGAQARLRWLERCSSSHAGFEFHPGPFEQLAKVFRDSGHPEDAREILIVKERRLRESRRLRLIETSPLLAYASAIWDAALDETIRFGHRPLRAFVWLAGFWLFGSALFFAASLNDAIKPNQPVAMRAPEWVACGIAVGSKLHPSAPSPDASTTLKGRALNNQSQRDCYEAQPEAAAWPEFNALVYSADTLLPVVSLEMQSYWIPDEDKNGTHWWSSLGWWARTYLWLHIAAGWALSLLAVAGFSGIVKSD